MRINYIENIDFAEGLKKIPDGSVDLIVTDPPYGTMAAMGQTEAAKAAGYRDMSWDKAIAPEELFHNMRRVLRPNGKCIIFAQEPYTSRLITQAVPELPFSYRAIWEKNHFANKFMCKKAMVSLYEDVLIFQKNDDDELTHPLREYFRRVLEFIGAKSCKEINKALGHRKAEHCFYVTNRARQTKKGIGSSQFSLCTESTYKQIIDVFGIDKMPGFRTYCDLKKEDEKYRPVFNLWQGGKTKGNVLKYPKDRGGLHPAQKPVALIEDLIQTYSNPGDLVLDAFVGSGTTALACINTGRNYIGFELDEQFHAIATKRITDTVLQFNGAAATLSEAEAVL